MRGGGCEQATSSCDAGYWIMILDHDAGYWIKWQVWQEGQVLRRMMVKVLLSSSRQEQLVRRRSSRGRSKRLWSDGEDRVKQVQMVQ